jgi:pimeloyl-ACP methyl ester carboxylesterase
MPRTSQRIVDELHALVNNAHLAGPFVLVGHSFGGLNVRLFASEYPEEAAGIVLVDATHEDYPAREKTARPAAETRKMENAFGLSPPAAQSEFRSLLESAEEVRRAPPLPDVPLIVITAGRPGESEALNQLWMQLQKDLLAKAPNARQVMAAESSHYVQFDQPDLIVGAIREIVAARRSSGLAPRNVEAGRSAQTRARLEPPPKPPARDRFGSSD